MKPNGVALFLKEALTNFYTIGAVAPSSRSLARAMAQWLPLHSRDFVLELGPGTGSITQGLLDRGLAPDRLIAIEKSPDLANHLSQTYPQAKVINGDATEIVALMAQHHPNAAPFSWVVSSLPLMNFSAEIRLRIAEQIRLVLAPGGKLVQFTYHVWNKKAKFFTDFHYVDSTVVWYNLPPARVTVYEKPAPHSADSLVRKPLSTSASGPGQGRN